MRNKALLELRPTINIQAADKEIEAFQNETLRPILKFQNNLTLQLLKSNKYFDPSQVQQAKEKLEAHLSALLQKDKAFRNQLLGTVLGLMTNHEIEIYTKDKKEYHKRIVNMQLVRYVDQLSHQQSGNNPTS